MKNLTPKLHFIIFLISFSIGACPFISLGQKNIFDSSISKSIQLAKPTAVICDRPHSTVCNLIENNIFSTTCFGQNPFWENCISKWNSLHGTPQLNVFGPQLSAGVNHASMWAASEQWYGGQQFFGGEGIITGIPKLTPGKKYAFSMFKRYFSAPQAPTIDLDNFYIVLMKCADYLPLRTLDAQIPAIPDVAQIIYCEKDLTNNTFQRVLQTFTALDEYDIVWIFPKELTYVAGTTKQSWLELAKFEMISIDNFSAGVSPNPIFPNCNVTIGPNAPNCGFEGAIFTWYGPNGQIIPAPANQQIQVDASNSANVGNWTLKMVVPNVVTTNNTCSSPGVVQASVNLSLCSACPPIQQVNILSNATQVHGNSLIPYTIDGNKINVVCYPWEWGDRLKLQSSFSTNNTWYINNTPIPQWVIGTANGNEFFPLQRCMTASGSLCQPQNLIYTMEIKVSNPNSCNGISNPVYVLFNPTYSGIEYLPGSFRPGQSTTVNLFDYGSNSNYIWHNNYSGVIITPMNANWSNVSIFIPLSYANSNLDFPIDLINPWCSNSNYNNSNTVCLTSCVTSFFGRTQVQMFKPIITSNFVTQIFPNPTTNQITISSTETINSIEISDLMNPVLKRIKASNTKSVTVNVFDLKPGIYNCKITTSKGVENQKLIIQR